MRIIEKTIDAAEYVLKVFCVVILVAMSVSTLLQVIGRYLMPVPLSWTEELSRRSMSWLLFIAAPIAYRRNAQIGIDLVVNMLPKHSRIAASAVVDVMIGLFGVVMIVQGLELAGRSFRQVSSALNISMYYIYLVIPFSGSLILLFAVEKLLKHLTSVQAVKGSAV